MKHKKVKPKLIGRVEYNQSPPKHAVCNCGSILKLHQPSCVKCSREVDWSDFRTE